MDLEKFANDVIYMLDLWVTAVERPGHETTASGVQQEIRRYASL